MHARAGYVLVRVTVPPQELRDHGSLRIVVVDGFIERIEANAVPDRVRALVVERIAALVGRRHITLDEIERWLLTAGDVPGLWLRSTLVAVRRPAARSWCSKAHIGRCRRRSPSTTVFRLRSGPGATVPMWSSIHFSASASCSMARRSSPTTRG